jgi:hypothetical protein
MASPPTVTGRSLQEFAPIYPSVTALVVEIKDALVDLNG